ncbi:hypothetical protein NQ317_006055 [Molorchus minor]|uniref:Tetraspanin n=1 Tax=Molorchus minor TaxID=1323400 RepID=A0ABQ9K4R3_9CUCU|nr:hypothetical protein NQ317_006055 [Molorchus minor]
MGWDDDVVKCLVFWANFFLALVGITLLSLGITYKINLEELIYVIPKDYHHIIVIPILAIPLGSIIIAIAVFGCYGCITEKSNFVTVYGAVLLIIVTVQLAVGICAFLLIRDRQKFDRDLNVALSEVFRNYENVYEYKEIADLIQHRLKCCGTNGTSYWAVIPKSCYETDTKIIYDQPCPRLVSGYLNRCVLIVGIAVLIFSIAVLLGSVISLSFARYLKVHQRRDQYISPPFWW